MLLKIHKAAKYRGCKQNKAIADSKTGLKSEDSET